MKDAEIFPGQVKSVSYVKRYFKKRDFKLIQKYLQM